MKLRLSKVNSFITVVILASCSSAPLNFSSDARIGNLVYSTEDIKKYFRYQELDHISLKVLDEYILKSNLSSKENNEVIKLRGNIQKILSKKSFVLNLSTANIDSLKLIKLVYRLNLPIVINWDQSLQDKILQNSVSEKTPGFCSSVSQNALESIAYQIRESSSSTLIVYSDSYDANQKKLTAQFPEIRSIEFNQKNAQEFASQLLGIDASNKRVAKITKLNPNQELEFAPRSRDDIKNIILILEPDQYKSLLPAFRYHGGEKFQYINFISSLEGLDNSKQLLDFEDAFIPFPLSLSRKIKSREVIKLKGIMGEAMMNDWLLIEVMKQAGISSAAISGMTGNLEFQRNTCTRRIIPMQVINSSWITS